MADEAGERPSLFLRVLRHWLVRFIIMFVVMTALYAASQIPLSLARSSLLEGREWMVVIWELIPIPILLGVYALLVRGLEQRSADEIVLPRAPGGLVIGTAVGFALFSAVMAVLVLTRHGTVRVPPVIIVPYIGLALSIVSGVAEELIFRGAMFRIVEDRFGTLTGLLVSAGFFGLVHIGNPGATVISSIAIALEAGLLLGLAYTATRALWLPIGLHFAWNFTEGGVFGTEVSGGEIPGMLKTTLTGPDFMTGGSFGPEASIVAVVVCMSAAAIFLAITLMRGEWKDFTPRTAPRE
ncbi:MAG TPA: type II CAAX endopeptidase family protein [Rhizomicrobium sp.]|nr:type II CAAX endopeptidase family protein [Rhizomicrobium sp.]